MRSRPAPILLLLLLGVVCGWRVFAQQAGSGGAPSDDDRKRQFLKAREEMHTVPATPSPNATPAPKPKPKTRPIEATPKPTPKPTPVPTPTPKPTTPTPKPHATPTPTPHPKKTEATPKPQVTPKPRVTPAPVTPSPRVSVTPAPAPVVVEKSGREEERGLQPAETGGGIFSRWKYLSKSVRAEIDRAPVQRRRWRYIVVHNSGTRQGNAKAFEYYHLHVRKMQNGLAYHFVIGNGTSSGAGEVEVGNRWRKQLQGGHVHSDYLNNIALGICLVGDFNRDQPSQRQMASLDELIRYLRSRVGKIDGKAAIVKPHREINPPRWPTDCPGDRFPYSALRKYD